MIDRRALQTLVLLAEEGSVTRAAERLHATQPAMSASLRRLRETFGDPLLVRAGKRLVTTERADEILAKARAILELLEDLEQESAPFDPAVDALELRIEASDFTHRVLLAGVMRLLPEQAPRTRLSLRSLDFEGLERALTEGELDFAILPDFLAPVSMQARGLFEEDFVCLMRRGHPLDDAPLTGDAFSACPQVRVSPRPDARIDRVGAALGRSRDVRLTVSGYAAVPDVVAATDLIAIYPRGLGASLGEAFSLHELPFALEPISMSLVWHPRKQTSRAHRWARDFLARAAKQAYGEARPA